MIGDKDRQYLMALIYPVQFEMDPGDAIDRVLKTLSPDRFPPADLASAIRAALASDADLAALIPQPHSDAVLRAYLRKILTSVEPGSRQAAPKPL